MNKILVLQLIGVLHLVSLSQQQKEISSAECKGNCTTLSECPPIRKDFSSIFARIEYCDLAKCIVCCPAKIEPIIPTNKTLTFSERKCKEYNDLIFSKCEPQGLIVGGTKAEPGEFPHMALLGVTQEDDIQPIIWMCGGTLISPKYVISAAHCFDSDLIPNYVRLGELDYSTTSDNTQTQHFVIENYILHPKHDYENNYNDIVLIELDKEALLDKYVVPACLPTSNGTEYTYFKAAGWGATKTAGKSSTHLLKVVLERFDDAECKQKINLPDRLDDGLHNRTQVCAGSHVNSSDTCEGDSGGPLFVQHPTHDCMFELVGITSFSMGVCGKKDFPAVYVIVNLYMEWIENVVWKVGAK